MLLTHPLKRALLFKRVGEKPAFMVRQACPELAEGLTANVKGPVRP